MARSQYFVGKHDGQWHIRHREKQFGPYPTERMALRVAIDAANDAGRHNPEGAEVVLELLSGHRTIWSYGADPYPSG
jgi:hypothetical protein